MKVERLQIVSAFELDAAVALTLGTHVQAIAKKLRGHISQITVPEKAPAELPRLLVQMDRALLQVGLNRFQLVVEPPDHIADSYEESLGFARRYLHGSFDSLFDAKRSTFEWSGVVAVLNTPLNVSGIQNARQAAVPLVQRLTTFKWDDAQLASFGIKIGRRSGGFFRNYEISAYELHEVHLVTQGKLPPMPIDVGAVPITEVGITVSLDVNSKPAARRGDPSADLEATLADHAHAFASLRSDLNLEGLL